MKKFDGKVALITGGASGIGLATAKRFIMEGARVMICDLNKAAGENAVGELGAAARFFQVDISDQEQVTAMVNATVKDLNRIDILFNNAGIGSYGRTPDLNPEEWIKVIEVNLNAVFYGCRAAIPHMIKTGGGNIINTASLSGLSGDYAFGAYNASKAAVVNYTRSLALDHAKDNVRVNAICPGLIDTPLATGIKNHEGLYKTFLDAIPMGRAGSSKEVANVVFFLASDEASYVTGHIMTVDGGITAWTGAPNYHKFLGDYKIIR